MIFILFMIFVNDKMKKGIKNDSLGKILNIHDIVNTAKTGPGSKMVEGTTILDLN